MNIALVIGIGFLLLIVIGVPALIFMAVGKRKKDDEPQDQPQPVNGQTGTTTSGTTRTAIKWNPLKVIKWVLYLIVGYLGLMIVLSCGGCFVSVVDWVNTSAEKRNLQNKKLIEEYKKQLEGSSSTVVAPGPVSAPSSPLAKLSYADAKAYLAWCVPWKEEGWDDYLFFHQEGMEYDLIPYRGYQLPPISLALLPPETRWTVLDLKKLELLGSVRASTKRRIYICTSKGGVEVRDHQVTSSAKEQGEDVMLLMESNEPSNWIEEGDERLRAKLKINVTLSQEEAMVRLPVEKRFGITRKIEGKVLVPEFDLDRPVQCMTLPNEIAGKAVYWDLSIRCYPLWIADTDGAGRWLVPSEDGVMLKTLSSRQLTLYTPLVRIRMGEQINPDGTTKVPNVPGQKDPWILEEKGSFLTKGWYLASVEELQEEVRRIRRVQGKPDFDWNGNGVLFIEVPKMYINPKLQIQGMTVRVTLRLRTEPKPL